MVHAGWLWSQLQLQAMYSLTLHKHNKIQFFETIWTSVEVYTDLIHDYEKYAENATVYSAF